MGVTERQHQGHRPVLLAASTLILAVAGILLAFAGMMALFLGAEGPGVGALLSLLAWLLAPVAILGTLSASRVEDAGHGRLAACWARLPAWLVLLVGLLVLLALLAELAIWLTEFSGGGTVDFGHYVPIVAVLVCAAAFTAGYALVAPAGADGTHRGPVRHTDPVRRD